MDKTLFVGLSVILLILLGVDVYWVTEVNSNKQLYNYVKNNAYKRNCDITEITNSISYYEVFASRKYNEILTGKSKHVKGRTMFEINVKYTNYNTSNIYKDGYENLGKYNEALFKLSQSNITACYYDVHKNILEVTKKAILEQYKTNVISSIVFLSLFMALSMIFVLMLVLHYIRFKLTKNTIQSVESKLDSTLLFSPGENKSRVDIELSGA